VKSGKIEGWNTKRKARDKANHRLVKNKHLIVPGLLGAALIGALCGGTIAMSFGPEMIVYGAMIGAGLAIGFGGPSIIRALTE
jgi:hypothetical protein